MNVTSASMAGLPLAKLLTPNVGAPKDPASPFGAPEDRKTSSISPSSGSGGGSSPGLDVAKKLKAMTESLVALTLIQDPVERAKAAAHLYKQYAQVAKDYAAATADGRSAAQAAETAMAKGIDPATGQPIAPASADQAAEAAPDAAPVDPALAATDPAAQAAATAADPEAPVYFMSGRKPTFVADVFMEEIKVFAGAARQIYDAAVQEAKNKKHDKSKLHDSDKEVDAAKETLTAAAKEVEGPDATADGYMPSRAASVSSPPASASIVNVTA